MKLEKLFHLLMETLIGWKKKLVNIKKNMKFIHIYGQ
jgi:hypothetical protein